MQRDSRILTTALPLACAALLLGGTGAAAMDSCAGTFAATALGTLPRPLVVGIDVWNDSPRNLALAARFKAGLAAAGITVAGTSTALMSLNASFSSGTANADTGSFSDFSDFNAGGVQRDYPDSSMIGGNNSVGAQTLSLRVDLRPSSSRTAVWVASVQCTVGTSDTGQLAYDLGTLIGPIIGKRSERTRF